MIKIGLIILVLAFAVLVNSQCWLDSYNRGVGRPLFRCLNNEEFDVRVRRCFPKCRPGYTGIGSVCWGSCPKDSNETATTCGAFCISSKKACFDKNKALVKGGINLGISGVSAITAPTLKDIKNLASSNVELAIELLFDSKY